MHLTSYTHPCSIKLTIPYLRDLKYRRFAGVIHAGISGCTALTEPTCVRTYDSCCILLKN